MKATISIHPYKETGWKGWVIAIEDSLTNELWQRPFYFKADAKQLKDKLEGMSLEGILDVYGTHYFERIR